MSLITIFFISFGLIFVAELGDKTQLMVFTLALRYGGRPVLLGAFLAFALLSGSAAIVGKSLGELLDPELIRTISAWVFILFGLFMFFKRGGRDDAEEQIKPSARAGLIAAFSLIAISEMGDKTQIATLLLSVKYQNFSSVFLGSLAALSLASFIGILVAGRLHKFIPSGYITPVSALLFILMGIGTLILI
jgi:putative Ca2+/H+ antiporter (TMEM165/GDT1 family)